jgi:hypothetical protein
MPDAIAPGSLAFAASKLGPLAPYIIELLLPRRVPLEADEVASALRDTCGAIDVKRLAQGAFSLAYLDHVTRFADASAPMMQVVSYAEHLGDEAGRDAALEQTWGWREDARRAVSQARAVVVVADMPGLQPRERLQLFERLVRALVSRLPVLAIHWAPSQRIVDPVRYLAPTDEDSRILQAAVNVRLFKVGDGAPGEVLLDTIGLTPLLLPDIQCRLVGVDANAAASRLYAYAAYLFKKGDILKDGNTVDGVGGRWRCRRGVSSAPPEREVVEFLPDAPLAGFASSPVSGVRCPHCAWVPDVFSRWQCDCGFVWNTFDTRAHCPACDKTHDLTTCLQCKRRSGHGDWYVGVTR